MTDILETYANFFDPEKSPLSKHFGERFLKLNWIVNFQKAGTLFIMFILMVVYKNFSLGAWVYLALHGSYGMCWIIKDIVYPDKSFQQKVNLIAVFMVGAVLILYWGIGFMMMVGYGDQDPSPERIFCCIFMYVIGLVLMMLSDLQKTLTLKFK
jgi:succinate dehydrogenase hydrophobic anchor subunit